MFSETTGLPAKLQFVDDRPFFDFLSSARPYQSFTEQVESDRTSLVGW